jgi:amino-acid N-acetyltransferase
MPKQNSLDFFREAAPYIHQHRSKTVVLALGGNIIQHDCFVQVLKDIAILSTLGVKIVLVHGARPQVAAKLEQQQHTVLIENDLRVTDAYTLEVAKEVIGSIRIGIENQLTHVFNSPPIIHQGIGILSGNFITAQPMGVLEGVDYKFTGKVRKLNTALLQTLLEQQSIVLLSPLGFSPTGETFNLHYEDVASFAAKSLQADKLIFLQEEMLDCPRQAELYQLKQLREQFPQHQRLYQHIAESLEQGVQRVHLVDARIEGSLLTELYTRDGVGILFSASHYDDLHAASIEHVNGILALIKPLEDKGVLIKRSREQLELELSNFVVSERDKKVIACAACYPIADTTIGELACLVVDGEYRGQYQGDALLDYISQRALQQGLTMLLVLTTQTTDWFRERGFKEGSVDDLPSAKKVLYNFQRRSKILLKDLE